MLEKESLAMLKQLINQEGIKETIKAIEIPSEGLIFTNLVDFDMHYGHRRDLPGYAKCLMEFDVQLPAILASLKADDLLIITADHGNDPSAPGTDHTREYIPILTYNKLMNAGKNIGIRQSFADIAATIADALGVAFKSPGKSFFSEILLASSGTDIGVESTSKPVTYHQSPITNTIDLIKKKRDGLELNKGDFSTLINGFISGQIPDYQVSAFLMAVYFKGLNKEETAMLTDVMMHSGAVINLSIIKGIKVDKHSTGGVGDKTTLILAPLVAAAGVPVAKMSGRGLGHTGGTLDKLEAIKGLSVDMSEQEFFNKIKKHGIAVCGQNESLVPADKKLYALRDVTGTVDNPSLIASSIMSKKLACGADAIVIDIKVGKGAYMKTKTEAKALAKVIIGIGKKMNRKVIAVISAMHEPLGLAVGNALEVKEAIDTLKGNGPKDLVELCLELGSQMLVVGQVAKNKKEATKKLKKLIASGKAFEKFKEFVKAQDGDIAVIEQPELLPQSRFSEIYKSKKRRIYQGVKRIGYWNSLHEIRGRKSHERKPN